MVRLNLQSIPLIISLIILYYLQKNTLPFFVARLTHPTNTFTALSKGTFTLLSHQWRIQPLTPNLISHFHGSNQSSPTRMLMGKVLNLVK
ncbi:hypothetical protein DEO72_LG4g1125 [Vigna unguiculata]|uniref:Uncharacterized protein n=1 Tax=Vigna unguiculata TaxID=3917 RepID=A0A4D6LNT7_VIGUN|nr:hypothetical protein DEO72_LG4g1125 [Vigna unguiculata]